MHSSLQTRSFKFGNHVVQVKCRQSPDSQLAAEAAPVSGSQEVADIADGQVTDTVGWDIWDGATIALCEKLVKTPEIVQGKAVLELGAGVGVVGVLAGMLGASSVLITDYDDGALSIASSNIELNQLTATCGVQRFDWGSDPPPPAPAGTDTTCTRSFDVVLGSDLLYSSSMADKLFGAVEAILSNSPECSMLLSHQLRHSVTWNEHREPVVEDHDSVLSRFLLSCSPSPEEANTPLICVQIEEPAGSQSPGSAESSAKQQLYKGGEGAVCLFSLRGAQAGAKQ